MKAQPVLTRLALLCAMLLAARSLPAADAASANAGSAKPFLGEWALTTPGGKAGWLGVTEKDGKLAASVMWEAGSVEPWANAKVEGDTLIVSRPLQQGGRRGGNAANANPPTETINAKADGDTLQCTISRTRGGANAGEARKESFTGKRQPPMPPAPDLSKVKFGEPISLFNGKDLTGWRLVEKDAVNGWVVKDGALMSNPVQEPGQPHKNYGNLRTDREFEDFNLKLEANVAPNGNSGIYLRGIYEVQVADSFGHRVDGHSMGAVYTRLVPNDPVYKPAGEWQTFDITLVDRHATVILNGKKIIDNQPVLGCTGGALWSDPIRPGPIYLQGDHSVASFRNIILRPVEK